MPSYKYVAKDPEGRTVDGTLEAESSAAVVGQLRKQDLVIISVVEERLRVKRRMRQSIKLEDLVIFSRQMATMVDAGIALVQALDILQEQSENRAFAEIIGKVRTEIESGSSLSMAMAKHPRVFSTLFVSMVKAGEQSGALDDILERLATYLEKTASLQRKVQSAMIYPSLVISIAIIITLFLIIKVIPTFKSIFDLLGGTLPLPTRILITISDVVRRWFPLVVLGLAGLVVAFFRLRATDKGRLWYDQTLFKLPVIGILFQKVAIARFSRTLSTLIKSGVPILNSLEIVAKTAGNRIIERSIEGVRSSIRAGEPIAPPLMRAGVFPPMVVRMVAVGEQTGKLELMLTKIADFYEEQVDAAVAGLTSLIEPLIILFLGVVVGGIVISMFLPIFKITELIGK